MGNAWFAHHPRLASAGVKGTLDGPGKRPQCQVSALEGAATSLVGRVGATLGVLGHPHDHTAPLR
jgi:hypothetical protein